MGLECLLGRNSSACGTGSSAHRLLPGTTCRWHRSSAAHWVDSSRVTKHLRSTIHCHIHRKLVLTTLAERSSAGAGPSHRNSLCACVDVWSPASFLVLPSVLRCVIWLWLVSSGLVRRPLHVHLFIRVLSSSVPLSFHLAPSLLHCVPTLLHCVPSLLHRFLSSHPVSLPTPVLFVPFNSPPGSSLLGCQLFLDQGSFSTGAVY